MRVQPGEGGLDIRAAGRERCAFGSAEVVRDDSYVALGLVGVTKVSIKKFTRQSMKWNRKDLQQSNTQHSYTSAPPLDLVDWP